MSSLSSPTPTSAPVPPVVAPLSVASPAPIGPAATAPNGLTTTTATTAPHTHASVAAAAAAAVSAAAAAATASSPVGLLPELGSLENSKLVGGPAAAGSMAPPPTGANSPPSMTAPINSPSGAGSSLPPLPIGPIGPIGTSAASSSGALSSSYSPFLSQSGVPMNYPLSPYPSSSMQMIGQMPRPSSMGMHSHQMPTPLGYDASYNSAMMVKKFKKKINLACHFCDHAARRPGRQKTAMLVSCSSPHCRKVFCSRPSCYKKLPIGLRINTWEGFVEWKRQLEMGLVVFVCQHCVDESHCPGPQCQKRWQKRLHRGPGPIPGEKDMMDGMMMPPTFPQHGLLGLASLSTGPMPAATATTAASVTTSTAAVAAAAANANTATADATHTLTSLVSGSGASTSTAAAPAVSTTAAPTTGVAPILPPVQTLAPPPTLTALNTASKASSPMTSTTANALNAVAAASAAAAAAAAAAKSNGSAAATTAPPSLLHSYQHLDAYSSAAGMSGTAGSPPPGGLSSLTQFVSGPSAFAPALTRGSSLGLGPYHPPSDRVLYTPGGAKTPTGNLSYTSSAYSTSPSYQSIVQQQQQQQSTQPAGLTTYSTSTPLSSLSAAAHTAHSTAAASSRYPQQPQHLQHQQYISMVNQSQQTAAQQLAATAATAPPAPATTAPAASPKSKA